MKSAIRFGLHGLGCWCLAALLGAVETAQPNIIVFLVDDMGVMDTSVPFLTDEAGRPKRYPLNDYYRTPNMQRLAERGIRFNNFYAMSVCSPTRISIMTGQNAARHQATNWINPDKNNRGPFGPPDWDWAGLDSHDVTLPRLLEEAGYRTIHVGKGHFGNRPSRKGPSPKNLGFDINIGGASFGSPGSYYGQQKFGLGTRRASQRRSQSGKISRHRDVFDGGSDPRDQASPHGGRERGKAILSVYGPLRGACSVPIRSAVCRAL